MGGDADPYAVEQLAAYIHEYADGKLKTGWYSGKDELPDGCCISNFDYIKLGPYIEQLGGLDSETTNQRLYRVEEGRLFRDIKYFI